MEEKAFTPKTAKNGKGLPPNENKKDKKEKVNYRNTEEELLKKMIKGEPAHKAFEDVVMNALAYDRNIFLGDVDEESAGSIESVVRFWNNLDKGIAVEDREPIKLFIDSRGGSITSCFTIMAAIALSETPIYTINSGTCYSAGFFIFICGHKRFAYENSSFLFHEGAATMGGDAGKFRNFAAFYDKELEVLRKLVLDKTGISEELYEKHKSDDWWLFADEALGLGIVDEIATKFI